MSMTTWCSRMLVLLLVSAALGTTILAQGKLRLFSAIASHELNDIRVGEEGGPNNKCCFKAHRNRCQDYTPFQCRSGPICTADEEFQGTCTDATCNNKIGSQCLVYDTYTRYVDHCEVIGTMNPTGCLAGQFWCDYYHTPNAIAVSVKLCSSTSYKPCDGQPLYTCD